MQSSYQYTVERCEDGKVRVQLPQFPWALSVLDPDSDNEAIYNAAYRLLISTFEALMDEEKEIPDGEDLPTDKADARINVSFVVLAKIILFNEFRKANVTRRVFANRADTTETGLRRLFNLRHESRWSTLSSAFEALGIRTRWSFKVVSISHPHLQ